MPEFDRTAAALAVLADLDDDTTARYAEITFTDGEDRGICRLLRESITEEYRAGHVELRTRERVAGDVAAHLVDRSDTLRWFGAVRDILTLETTTEDYDPERVAVRHGGRLEDTAEDALRLRFVQAAYALLTVVEDDVDTQEAEHDDTDTTDE